MQVPEEVKNKREEIEKEREEKKQPLDVRLTKHFKELKRFEPSFTGNAFHVLEGGKFAIALNEFKVCLLELGKNQVLATFVQEKEDINTFAVSPNERLLATSTKNGLVRIHELPTIDQLGSDAFSNITAQKVFKHSNQLVVQMTFDPSSKFLATGTSDSCIKVFDVNGGFQTHNFMGHRGLIIKLAFYPGEQSLKLISTAEDFIIKVWDLVLKKEVAVMKPKGKTDNMAHMTTSLCFTKDGKTLITSGRDGQIHFWNCLDNFSFVSSLNLMSIGCQKHEEVLAMNYILVGDDPCILIGGQTGHLYVYSIKRQEMAYQSSLSNSLMVPDEDEPNYDSVEIQLIQVKNNTVFVVNGDQNLFVYSIVQKHQKLQSLELTSSSCLYMDEIIDAKFVNGNRFAVLCSNSETLKLMDLENGQTEIYPAHSDIIISLDTFTSSDGTGFIISGGKDNVIRLWRYDFSWPIYQRVKCLAVYHGHTHNISSVHFAPKKGKQFVSSSQDNTLKVWNCEQFMQPTFEAEVPVEVHQADMTIMAHQKCVNVAKFSPNDKLIASGSQDKTVKIWQAKDLKQIMELKGHLKGIWDLEFSPVDKQIATVSGDKLVKVWSLQGDKPQCVATFQGHSDQLVKIKWINSGLQVLSASVDGVTKVWNIRK